MSDVFEEIRRYCLSFPDAYEDHPWGDTVFKVGVKIFAFTGDSDPIPTVTVKIPDELRTTWMDHESTFFPSYVGRFGWIGIRVSDEDSAAMANTGIEFSYRRVCGKRRWPGDTRKES